jgi:hypothetical protein
MVKVTIAVEPEPEYSTVTKLFCVPKAVDVPGVDIDTNTHFEN